MGGREKSCRWIVREREGGREESMGGREKSCRWIVRERKGGREGGRKVWEEERRVVGG